MMDDKTKKAISRVTDEMAELRRSISELRHDIERKENRLAMLDAERWDLILTK